MLLRVKSLIEESTRDDIPLKVVVLYQLFSTLENISDKIAVNLICRIFCEKLVNLVTAPPPEVSVCGLWNELFGTTSGVTNSPIVTKLR